MAHQKTQQPNPNSTQAPDDFGDFGFTFSSSADDEKWLKVDKRFEKLYDLFVGFLTNLSKDPEQDTIKWSTRSEDIVKLLKKINEIKDNK
jgi:hypothetical protein